MDILNKPEFIFHPINILRRIQYEFYKGKNLSKTIDIFGRFKIKTPIDQVIGRSLFNTRVYELGVTEMLCRLIRPADNILDVGANIGYTSLVMASKLEKPGHLYSFEPNADLFPLLEENLFSINRYSEKCTLYKVGLSDQKGISFLSIPQGFEKNNGIAFINESPTDADVKIETETLDNLFPTQQFRLMKMDVEGHELKVLQGGKKLLDENRISYILFEDHIAFPSPVATYLIERGYSIYKLAKRLQGLYLTEPINHTWDIAYEPSNYLATKDKGIVEVINKKLEWQFLR